jgi:hypothetical protein
MGVIRGGARPCGPLEKAEERRAIAKKSSRKVLRRRLDLGLSLCSGRRLSYSQIAQLDFVVAAKCADTN